MVRLPHLLLLGFALVSAPTAAAQDKKAPEFPPGFFSDGADYAIGDFQGKVLVLYFFEGS